MSAYPTQAIVKALVAHLKEAVPTLKVVFDEWPAPGQVLTMPAACVLVTNSRFIPGSPREISMGSIVNHKADVLYYVGAYEMTLSVDVWTPNKTDRAMYLDLIMNALSPDFASGYNGVELTLDYESQVASYLATGFDIPVSEEAAQRREWRAKVTVDAICNAVRESRQPIMENIEVELETTTGEIEE